MVRKHGHVYARALHLNLSKLKSTVLLLLAPSCFSSTVGKHGRVYAHALFKMNYNSTKKKFHNAQRRAWSSAWPCLHPEWCF